MRDIDMINIDMTWLTQYNQGVANETGNADKRKKNEHRPWNGAFKFMVESEGFVVPMEIVSEVIAHFTEHDVKYYWVLSPSHLIKSLQYTSNKYLSLRLGNSKCVSHS